MFTLATVLRATFNQRYYAGALYDASLRVASPELGEGLLPAVKHAMK